MKDTLSLPRYSFSEMDFIANDPGPELLTQTLKEEHQGAGLFQRSGQFPAIHDPEFPVSPIASDYYKNGPLFLARYLPFWMTVYAQRAIAFIVKLWRSFFPPLVLRPDSTSG
jgi:hypothetical protein